MAAMVSYHRLILPLLLLVHVGVSLCARGGPGVPVASRGVDVPDYVLDYYAQVQGQGCLCSCDAQQVDLDDDEVEESDGPRSQACGGG